MKENVYQAKLIKRIKNEFDECMVLKNDSGYLQGIPDILVLCGKKWAALEVKQSRNAHVQPNQNYYISKMMHMSYATFISPENENRIFKELHALFCE